MNEVEQAIKAAAIEKAKADLDLGYQYIEYKYPGEWRVEDGVLFKGDTKINDHYEMVDEIGQLTGGDTVTSSRAMGELSANVEQIAENTQAAAALAANATDFAANGNESIQKAVNQMNAINDTISGLAQVIHTLGSRSQEIGQIMEAITGIA